MNRPFESALEGEGHTRCHAEIGSQLDGCVGRTELYPLFEGVGARGASGIEPMPDVPFWGHLKEGGYAQGPCPGGREFASPVLACCSQLEGYPGLFTKGYAAPNVELAAVQGMGTAGCEEETNARFVFPVDICGNTSGIEGVYGEGTQGAQRQEGLVLRA